MAVNLVVGTNSYISVADADEYFSCRLHSEVWSAATDDDKAKALITATRQIDRLSFKGRKILSSQDLAFPRYPPGYICNSNILSNILAQSSINIEVPKKVKDATCEESYALLKGISKRIELQQQGVKQAKIGDIEETYTGNKIKLISSEARELLRPYMLGCVRIT